MYSNVYPLILVAVGSLLVAMVAAILAWRVRRKLYKALLILVALVFAMPAGLVFAMCYPVLIDGRYRTYKQLYGDIRVDMTREQVLAAMEHRYPADGPRQKPKIWHDDTGFLCFFMNPEEQKEPNCEGIFLTMDKGHVAKIAYGAD